MKKSIVKELLNGDEKYYHYKIIKLLVFGSSGKKVVLRYRLAKYLYDKNIRFLPTYMIRNLEKKYGVYISPKATIGVGLKFPHPTGIVIGEGVEIGSDCTIYQQVTLGGARLGDGKNNYYPNIGNNIVIFAGAKIIGNISIMSNSIVGANCVVNKNVPENCTVVGVPGKVIKVKENDERN